MVSPSEFLIVAYSCSLTFKENALLVGHLLSLQKEASDILCHARLCWDVVTQVLKLVDFMYHCFTSFSFASIIFLCDFGFSWLMRRPVLRVCSSRLVVIF